MKGDSCHLPELCACAAQDTLCGPAAICWTPGGVPPLCLLGPNEFILFLRKVVKALQQSSSQTRSIFGNKGEGNGFNLFDAHARIVLRAAWKRESAERLNVQPQAARANCFKYGLPSRAAWRLQRFGLPIPLQHCSCAA